MTLDVRARKTALALIDKFGKSISLVSVVDGIYDPLTGDISPPVQKVVIIRGLIEATVYFDVSRGMVVSNDKKVAIAAKGIDAPKIADRLTIDSVNYSVISVNAVYSGELAALYELRVSL